MMGSFIDYHSIDIPKTQTVCLRIVYAETKNSGLRLSVSRCNRSVDQLGLEPRTSRL